MEQSPSVSRLFHVRMVSVLWTLFGLDLFLVAFAIEVLVLDKNRMGIMIMFASEFMILSATLFSIIAKYVINVQDLRSEEPWEGKSMYVFFVDLATDFLKLMTYLTFFGLILSFYGLPLNIIRDVYVTARSFFGRLRDFIKYRAATKNMDTRFPDATRQDLSATSDGTCIICREEMVARSDDVPETEEATSSPLPPRGESSSGLNETPKKLPCGHIFHFHCLRSWLERQQSCPTCRRTVFATPSSQQNTGGNDQEGGPLRPAPTNEAGGATGNNAAGSGTGPGVATGANAAQTARDRLQGFLQQLQTDAQRVREQAERQMPRAGQSQPGMPTPTTSPQSTTSGTAAPTITTNRTVPQNLATGQGDADGTSSARGRALPRPLISSLFGQSDGASRRGMGEVGANQSHSSVSRLDQRDELIASLVPPAPWTLKPTRANASPGRFFNTAESSSSISQAQDGSITPKENVTDTSNATTSKESVKSQESVDPADAREAARAAALRRFEARSSRSIPSTSKRSISIPDSRVDVPKVKITMEAKKPINLPGDPHLIPLFDTSKVVNFENDFAAHLPFPLVNGVNHPIPPFINRTNDNLLGQVGSLLELNADQLRTLSQRNRRGLEERLQLLTRVEGAIGGLVEELTRALSVLPSDDDVELNEEQHDHQSKGKEAAEGIHRGTSSTETPSM